MRATMNAVLIESYGGNEVVRIGAVERPAPGPGEMLVKVKAAGVNPLDWKIRNGAGQRMGLDLPIRLGGEIAGEVAALGAGNEGWREGDAVYGIVPSGGFADYALARSADMARPPAGLDLVQAAAIPLGALTAWQALFDLAALTEGQRLLVTNGSGGVGSLAVQLAKARGAHVTALASERSADYVRGLGVDVLLDRAAPGFEERPGNSDVVFDTVGGETYERAFAVLRPGGFLVTAVAFPSEADRQRGVGLARVQCRADAAELRLIGGLVESGRLAARIGAVLPLSEVRQALDLSEHGRAGGKIVLRMAE